MYAYTCIVTENPNYYNLQVHHAVRAVRIYIRCLYVYACVCLHLEVKSPLPPDTQISDLTASSLPAGHLAPPLVGPSLGLGIGVNVNVIKRIVLACRAPRTATCRTTSRSWLRAP